MPKAGISNDENHYAGHEAYARFEYSKKQRTYINENCIIVCQTGIGQTEGFVGITHFTA